jgi:transposase
MVPIPDEGDEDVRHSVRERAELLTERVALVNRIGAVLATMGCAGYNPLLRNTRQCLDELRTAFGTSFPPHAHAKINCMLDRLDLVCAQIAELERDRDAVLQEEEPDKAGEMIQQLAKLRGIGAQSATVRVREAFVREFANGKALGSYAGLCATPYSSGRTDRERGISKAGNRRLRTVMIELAWLWQRYQPGYAEVSWFRARVSGTGARMRKVMVVALARKLLMGLPPRS